MNRRSFALAGLLMLSSAALAQDYAGVSGDDRVSYVSTKKSTGNTIPIPLADITRLCGDMDGCKLRLGMLDWGPGPDVNGRVASREFLFYYNPQTKTWRSSANGPCVVPACDPWGHDANGTTEHVANAWSCYVTDGEYVNSTQTDTKAGFGLLSWNTPYNNVDCWLTIVD